MRHEKETTLAEPEDEGAEALDEYGPEVPSLWRDPRSEEKQADMHAVSGVGAR